MAHVVLDVEPLRASSVERRASSVERRASSVERRASSVERRASNIEVEVELAKYLGVDFAAPATMLVIA